MVPGLGALLLGCTGIIAATDASARVQFPPLAAVIVGLTALLSVVAMAAVVRGGHARARQAPMLDALAEGTGGERPQLGFLAAPRVWCTVGGARFSVVAMLQGRNAPALPVEDEDSFRALWLEAASAPNARIPKGRHWRLAISGDAPSAYRLVVAAKGPLSMLGARSAGLERVKSGDVRFDDWVAVYADRREAAERLVADPERRDTLLSLVTSNGPYTTSLQFGPPRSPREPCLIHGFVLHARQTPDSLVEGLHRILQVATWTHETA